MRSLPIRAGILGNNYIIRLEAKLFCALRYGQDGIGADRELRFLELLQTAFYRVCIAVGEKDAKGPASVGSRAFRTATPMVRLDFVLSQV